MEKRCMNEIKSCKTPTEDVKDSIVQIKPGNPSKIVPMRLCKNCREALEKKTGEKLHWK